MIEWSVKGIGAEVTVVSPEGDIFPFVITSTEDLHLTLRQPVWHDTQAPAEHGRKLDIAVDTASRWTQQTFGALPSQ